MKLIDEQYMKTPVYGSRSMRDHLDKHQGYKVNRKRVQRLMRLMGLEAIYPKPKTSKAHPGHRIYPYLLKGLDINRPDMVWATDITYIPLRRGFMYRKRQIKSTLQAEAIHDRPIDAMRKKGSVFIRRLDQG